MPIKKGNRGSMLHGPLLKEIYGCMEVGREYTTTDMFNRVNSDRIKKKLKSATMEEIKSCIRNRKNTKDKGHYEIGRRIVNTTDIDGYTFYKRTE
jgi:hypothetical protein